MKHSSWARRALHFLGIDQAVAFTLGGYFWIAASGPALLALVIWRLNLAERGVLFNYVSICQFQILFEIGTATVVQQLASRERAHLRLASSGTLEGDPQAKARLAALFRIGLVWFFSVMAIVILTLLPIGWAFFSRADGLENVDWQAAWVLSALVAATQGLIHSVLLFLSGCGDVTLMARVTAVQNIIMPVAQGLALLAGTKLLSHPIAGATGLAVTLGWVVVQRRGMLTDLWRTDHTAAGFRWRSDVWPMQWRTTLSWLSLIAVTQMLNPMVLAFQGARVAGQVGLSVYVLMMLQAMGSGWVGTKVPSFGILAAQRKWAELDASFRSVLLRSLLFVAALALAVTAADAAMYYGADALPAGWLGTFGSGQPLVHPGLFALLSVAALAIHVLSSQASYLRAHGRESMLGVYGTLAFAIAATLIVTGKYGSVVLMALDYTLWTLLGLAAGTLIFFRRRRQLHV